MRNEPSHANRFVICELAHGAGRTASASFRAFAEHGTVTSAKVITDRQTNRSRGFGFVEMSDGGENAIQALNDAEVDGRKLVVNESRPRD